MCLLKCPERKEYFMKSELHGSSQASMSLVKGFGLSPLLLSTLMDSERLDS